MVELPKHQFLNRKEDAEHLGEILAQPAIRTAITYAFAQMSYSGVTTEELNGAKKFITILTTLHEPELKRKGLPAKNLSQ